MGCGSATDPRTSTDASSTTPLHGRPQVVQPIAGQVGQQSLPRRGYVAPVHPPTPGQPASVTAAPAVGAPTDAQIKAAEIKFKQAIQQYHLDQYNFSGALINPPPGQYYTSIASVYTDYGLGIACGGVLHVTQLGVANKTLPCGTMIIFVYNGRAIRIPVIDRGPYIAGREWDLTGAAAEALHFPGLGPIQWRYG